MTINHTFHKIIKQKEQKKLLTTILITINKKLLKTILFIMSLLQKKMRNLLQFLRILLTNQKKKK